MTIALIDYGIGNLRSVKKALEAVGGCVKQTHDLDDILAADKVVLSGVGAFRDGMTGLASRHLIPVLREIIARHTPLLGICVGMQLLLETSEEGGISDGLGVIAGQVRAFPSGALKIPHTGWNQLQNMQSSALLTAVEDRAHVYFNHGYYCDVQDATRVIAWTHYGLPVAAAVQVGSVYGVQFHPEKSQQAGLTILRNFVAVCQ